MKNFTLLLAMIIFSPVLAKCQDNPMIGNDSGIVITFLFPVVAGEYKFGSGHVFAFFSIMMLIQAVVVWKYFPETKGKTLEELGDELSKDVTSAVVV